VATVTAFRGLGYGEPVPSDMDVVSGVFGAGAGLAGLLLVFLGTSLGAFQSYAGDVPAGATLRFRRAGAWILAAFLLGLLEVAASFAWLLSPHRGRRDLAGVLFGIELAATASAAVTTARAVLWR